MALAPDGERWAALAPTVVDAATRATHAEFVAVLAALQLVRARLVAVLAQYPELRREIEGGKLAVLGLVAASTAFDRIANLLARYAERPATLLNWHCSQTRDSTSCSLRRAARSGPAWCGHFRRNWRQYRRGTSQ